MVQAFDDTDRAGSGPPTGGQRDGRSGPSPTISRQRSPSSAPCCCHATPSPRRWRTARPRTSTRRPTGYIFEAITSLYGRGEPADYVTVPEELRRRELLDSIGDTSVFVTLQANTPSVGNAEYYAKIVEELALLRRLVAVAGRDLRTGLFRARGRDRGPRPGRESGVRRRPAPGGGLHDAARGAARRHPRPSGAALQPERVGHRTGHRLHGPGRDSSPGSSPPTWSSSEPGPPWGRRPSRWAWWPTPGSS